MGSGKSSVGRLVARTLQGRFVDTDRLITDHAGCEITEIFATHGEAHFRALETAVLRSLLGSTRFVVATGGGIVTVESNTHLLKQLGFVVWLTASEQVIWDRVSRNRKRPLLHTDNPRQTIQDLLGKRNPIYESVADLKIDTTLLTHEEVAQQICERLEAEF